MRPHALEEARGLFGEARIGDLGRSQLVKGKVEDNTLVGRMQAGQSVQIDDLRLAVAADGALVARLLPVAYALAFCRRLDPNVLGQHLEALVVGLALYFVADVRREFLRRARAPVGHFDGGGGDQTVAVLYNRPQEGHCCVCTGR